MFTIPLFIGLVVGLLVGVALGIWIGALVFTSNAGEGGPP